MSACSRSYRFCIQTWGWKSKGHLHPPFFSGKNGIGHLKICISPKSCICKVDFVNHEKICIGFLLGNSFHSITFCRLNWKVQAWSLVFWWSGQRGNWIHICNFPCRNGCRDNSTDQHEVYHTCQNTYWLQNIVQGKNSLLSQAQFLASNTLKIPCCTWVDDYNYDTIKSDCTSHIIINNKHH